MAGFGVTFGVIVCFDLEFWRPAAWLVAAGVRDVVVSMAWSNTPPLQSAVALQQAWSRRFGANLIAANSGQDPYLGECTVCV